MWYIYMVQGEYWKVPATQLLLLVSLVVCPNNSYPSPYKNLWGVLESHKSLYGAYNGNWVRSSIAV